MSRRRDDDTTVKMFYGWYYAPISHARFPGNATVELFETSAKETWSSRLLESEQMAHSPEYITLFNAAVQGDTLTWTLVGLTYALLCCHRSPDIVVSVPALVFSILNDPHNFFRDEPRSVPSLVQALLPMFHLYPSEEATSTVISMFQNFRYNPESALGKRLQEDVRLWVRIAADCGLPLKFGGTMYRSPQDEAEIACTVLGLLQQSWPWVARILPSNEGRFNHLVILRNHCLWIASEATLAMHFIHQLQAVGINIDFDDDTTRQDLSCQLNIRPTAFHMFQERRLMHGEYMKMGSWWGGPYEDLLEELDLRISIPVTGFSNGEELPG